MTSPPLSSRELHRPRPPGPDRLPAHPQRLTDLNVSRAAPTLLVYSVRQRHVRNVSELNQGAKVTGIFLADAPADRPDQPFRRVRHVDCFSHEPSHHQHRFCDKASMSQKLFWQDGGSLL